MIPCWDSYSLIRPQITPKKRQPTQHKTSRFNKINALQSLTLTVFFLRVHSLNPPSTTVFHVFFSLQRQRWPPSLRLKRPLNLRNGGVFQGGRHSRVELAVKFQFEAPQKLVPSLEETLEDYDYNGQVLLKPIHVHSRSFMIPHGRVMDKIRQPIFKLYRIHSIKFSASLLSSSFFVFFSARNVNRKSKTR